MAPGKPLLLAVIELGGYPNFAPLYQRLGFDVATERSVRKALAFIKHHPPAVIVAEFNFQSDFRDRTSSLESLLAVVQCLAGTRVIAFYQKEHAHQLAKLTSRFPVAALPYPIDPAALEAALTRRGG